ncbi:MAG: YafY family transcriptional regulator [Bacteroidetes bacterium]|nr:YafY family transcriptional regulator [Bacteroidota bacterium]
MNSSERRLKLILLLQQPGRKKSVKELADIFGVSRRTIFRDFNALSEINVPINYDRYLGYGLVEGYKMPPLMFNSKELATIMVGLNFVKSQVDQQMVQDATGVELKIKNVLPTELKGLMNSLEEHTIVDPYLKYNGRQKMGGDWYMISSAIASKKRLQFVYTTRENETATRKIDPYMLVYFEDHWNVIGWSHKRGDFRSFVLDRVASPVILDEEWSRKQNIDVDSLIFRFNGPAKKIILDVDEFEMERLRANLPAKIIKQKQIRPKKIRLEFEFDHLPFINEWLLQFGPKVVIHKPLELRDMQKTILNEMIKNLD